MIREYQPAGFFRGQPVNRAAALVTSRYREENGEPLRVRTRLEELTILGYDSRRAWYEDLERDVIEGNDQYVAAFTEWSRISSGAFRPRAIQEHWKDPENGPVDITFQLAGRDHVVRAEGQGDFLDLCVLITGINPLIRASGRQFAIYRPDPATGQKAFVVALTAGERANLEHKRWQFADRSQARLAFAYGRLYEKGTTGACH